MASSDEKPFLMPAISSAADCLGAIAKITAAAAAGRISTAVCATMVRICVDAAHVDAETRLEREQKNPVRMMPRRIPK
jgi:hypothetical protein